MKVIKFSRTELVILNTACYELRAWCNKNNAQELYEQTANLNKKLEKVLK